ncbi:MAG: hypothetical protein IIB83_07560 [Bacteroidetes bacterium]|nr:hypothetical protein [Bacteroidota bacterium]
MTAEENTRNCFLNAKKDEDKRKKHKGLLVVEKDDKNAEEYLQKAKTNLEFCGIYKEKRLDYKIPEEWFYTMYYCALAILSKFGVETRNQKCTALFLRYVKDKGLINYDDEFIDRITVYSDKDVKSDVDEREDARYGSSIEINEVEQNYDKMMGRCKEAISQCEEIVFSESKFDIPEELVK